MSVTDNNLASLPPHRPGIAAGKPVSTPWLISTLLATLPALVMPRQMGRFFLRVPLWQALVIGGINLLPVIQAIRFISGTPHIDWILLYPHVVLISGVVTVAIMMFFVILPFAPRPPRPAGDEGGAEPTAAPARVGTACLRHVLRTLLLGSTLIYPWYAVFWSLYHWALSPRPPLILFPDDMVAILGLGGGLLAYSLWVLISLVDQEEPMVAIQALPAALPPRCEECGYILTGLDPVTGNCPECGKPIRESLGDSLRRPNAWEQAPEFQRVGVILTQSFTLFLRSKSFYQTLCLRQGHAASRRWLRFSILLTGLSTTWIVLGLRGILGSEIIGLGFRDWQFYALALAIGTVWMWLALMMVGIETAGIAFISHRRDKPVDLAAASRITSYASTTLLYWVLTGGMQIMLLAWYYQIKGPQRVGSLWDALISVGSLFVAHIGGLLWYEFTVYRGLWTCQYANR
ncbi:MAG: hypothetical protein WCI73_12795 [Phycisphaerae bacterium]